MRKILIAVLTTLLCGPAWAQTPAPSAPAAPAPPAASPAKPAAPRAAAKPAATSGMKVDVNGATEKQLEGLPGIGQVRAKAIIAGRPYEELADLVKKKVLTQGVLDKAKPGMALANINTSTAAQMEKTLPGVGDVRAKAIVTGRPYATPQDLVVKGVLTQAVLDHAKDVMAY